MKTQNVNKGTSFGMSWHKSYFFSISGFKKSNIIAPSAAKILDKKAENVVAVFAQTCSDKVACTVFKKNWFNQNFPKLRYFFSNFYVTDNPKKYGYAKGCYPVDVFNAANKDLITKQAQCTNNKP